MHRYKDLLIWQRAIKLSKPVYILASLLPDEERFGLIQQIKRAVVSISLSIFEGAVRRTKKDFSHFLDMAIGSFFEVDSCIYVGLELEFINQVQADPFLSETTELVKMTLSSQNNLK
jgi:four helix bundle protein